jgi:hypothetical protein
VHTLRGGDAAAADPSVISRRDAHANSTLKPPADADVGSRPHTLKERKGKKGRNEGMKEWKSECFMEHAKAIIDHPSVLAPTREGKAHRRRNKEKVRHIHEGIKSKVSE